MYQYIWQNGEIEVRNTPEESESRLSGIIVNNQGKLKIYNRIYREVFNNQWIDTKLANLRPYAEAFKAWINSGNQDESRLLRGKALEEAETWSTDKDLSFQDKEFLAASREKEAELEREKKEKEATEKANKLLTEANKKAQQRIKIGSIILISTILVAWGLLSSAANEIKIAKEKAEQINLLSELGGELLYQGKQKKGDEVLKMAGLSLAIKDDRLRKALLLNIISLIYQDQAQLVSGKLDNNKLEEAEKNIEESLKFLEGSRGRSNPEKLQILVHAYFTRGQLYQLQQNNQAAEQYYKKAVDILNLEQEYILYNVIQKRYVLNNLSQEIQILTESEFKPLSNIFSLTVWEAVYLQYMKLLSKIQQDTVRTALTNRQYDNLEYLLISKKWQEADLQTYRLIVVEAQAEDKGYLSFQQIENFRCDVFHKIDETWEKYSGGKFGFSVQKKIYLETGNNLDTFNEKTYENFLEAIGWARKNSRGSLEYLKYAQGNFDNEIAKPGHLPIALYDSNIDVERRFFALAENCTLQ